MRTVQRAADGGIAARTAWLNGLLRASGTQRRRVSETGSGMRQVGETEGEASLPRFSICLYAQSGQKILSIRVAPQEYCSCPCK